MNETSRQPGVMHPRLPLPEAVGGEDLETFFAWLREAIPQVAHYGIQQPAWKDSTLSWRVALADNLNDKGTGFGGALAGEATLLGWCWTTLWLRAQGRAQDVVIAEGQQRFLAPVTTDYHMQCFPLEADGITRLDTALTEKGRGRIKLVQRVYCGDTLCMEAQGSYAVLK